MKQDCICPVNGYCLQDESLPEKVEEVKKNSPILFERHTEAEETPCDIYNSHRFNDFLDNCEKALTEWCKRSEMPTELKNFIQIITKRWIHTITTAITFTDQDLEAETKLKNILK